MPPLPSDPPRATVVQPGQGGTLAVGSNRIAPPLDAQGTDGEIGMIVYDVSSRFVTPAGRHWHTKESWTGYVLSGRIKLAFLDGNAEIPTGGAVHVPAYCPFLWANPPEDPARVLFIYAPGGFEIYFRDLGEILAQNPGVPVKDLSPKLAPLWERYGLESES